jgi:hypothetical protein
LQLELAAARQPLEGGLDIHLATDRRRRALEQAAVADRDADAGLAADGERRLPDRALGDIDRLRCGMAGGGEGQKRGEGRASGQRSNS